jgi:hypothetical protein
MSTRKLAWTLLALLAGAAPVLAQDKPDFSGTWALDVAKSDFGSYPAPQKATLKIDHQDPKLNIVSSAVSDMGEQNIDLKLLTDGTETTNDVMGMPVKSKGKWDEKAVVIESKFSIDQGDVTLTDRWTLSEDGKTLTVERHWAGAAGDTNQKLIHTKQ